MSSSQLTFQLCSYLLSYPDVEFSETLTSIKNDIEQIQSKAIRIELSAFIQKAEQKTLSELIHTFVYTFDFGRKTNLYVTYMTSGEQRERGIDLLYLKNYYQLHGYSVTEQELPDFLPLMLEFAAQVNIEVIKPVFSKYYDNVKEISNQLEQNNHLYSHIFQAIILALKDVGITKSARRSDELCLNNFCG